jgi:hypothetical protein
MFPEAETPLEAATLYNHLLDDYPGQAFIVTHVSSLNQGVVWSDEETIKITI